MTKHDAPALSRRIAALDAMYSQWIPGFADAHGERLAGLQSSLADQGIAFTLGARTTLPSSVLHRAVLIEKLAPKHVVLFGDVDGLGSLLTVPVSVVAADAIQSSVIGDLAVIEVGDHPITIARLESAIAAVGPKGGIVARVRWPWDRSFYEHVRIMGLKIIGYERDVDHVLIPSGHVVDGGGDLVVVSAAVGATAPALPEDASDDLSKRLPTSVNVPPYAWFDMDGIVGDATLDVFIAEVERLSKRTRDLVDHQKYDDREVLCWYDANGRGLVAELDRESGHLLVSYSEYDDLLDHAAMTAAFTVFADEDTRVRPRRTERTPDRPVFA